MKKIGTPERTEIGHDIGNYDDFSSGHATSSVPQLFGKIKEVDISLNVLHRERSAGISGVVREVFCQNNQIAK